MFIFYGDINLLHILRLPSGQLRLWIWSQVMTKEVELCLSKYKVLQELACNEICDVSIKLTK